MRRIPLILALATQFHFPSPLHARPRFHTSRLESALVPTVKTSGTSPASKRITLLSASKQITVSPASKRLTLAPAPAQQPSPQATSPPTGTLQSSRLTTDNDVVKITTNLVQIDAIVTDKNGNLIRDLRPDELQIFDDGREQKITNFSFVSTEAPTTDPTASPVASDKTKPPLPPVKLRPENIRRTIALVVDDQPDLKRLAVGGGIQLPAQIPFGEYVFQVTVTDPLADEKHRTATQWMDLKS